MRVMGYILIVMLCATSNQLTAQSSIDSLFQVLDKEIEQSPKYITERVKIIDALKSSQRLEDNYELNRQIYNLYRSFQYDSAYIYAAKCLEIAIKEGDNNLVLESRSNLLFSLLSAGFFKEGIDIIDSTNNLGADSLVKADFYSNAARLYSDLSHYHNPGSFRELYIEQSNIYCDSAMALLPQNGYEYKSLAALKSYDNRLESRISDYRALVDMSSDGEHRYAINCANLANLLLMKGDTISAIELWTRSAIVDTRLSIMETTAKRDLAKTLYKTGDIYNAMRYIHSSLEEASYYNAKHRLLQINYILPIIEKSHLSTIENQRDTLSTYLLFVVALAALLALMIYILYRKNSTINRAKSTVEHKSKELEQMNSLLEQMNRRLQEQDKIKNTYILESLNSNSTYLSNTESMLRKIVNKLRQSDNSHLLRGIGIEQSVKQERQQLYASFDRAFLILFPNFIEQYNSLFSEEFHAKIDNSGSLNAEMRIVAIIRLDIKDSDKIAQFLNLSVNTVYTYKTKIKSRCRIKNKEIESTIMEKIY